MKRRATKVPLRHKTKKIKIVSTPIAIVLLSAMIASGAMYMIHPSTLTVNTTIDEPTHSFTMYNDSASEWITDDMDISNGDTVQYNLSSYNDTYFGDAVLNLSIECIEGIDTSDEFNFAVTIFNSTNHEITTSIDDWICNDTTAYTMFQLNEFVTEPDYALEPTFNISYNWHEDAYGSYSVHLSTGN